MQIYRHGEKGNYRYTDKRGKPITDRGAKEFLSKLAVPPAYSNVIIYYPTNRYKIMYQGIDKAGRPQFIYASWWSKKMKASYFCDLIEFGKQLPRITADINAGVKLQKLTKNKLICIILKIVSSCYFRIGNSKYEELYGSYGVSNLLKKHITFDTSKRLINISFIGKKGVLNECSIKDNDLYSALYSIALRRKSSDHMFKYHDRLELKRPKSPNKRSKSPKKKSNPDRKIEHKSNSKTGGKSELIERKIKHTDVNNWLKSYNKTFTSKMFRTFSTNTLFIDKALMNNDKSLSKNQRKKLAVGFLKEISCIVHNTPAICKKDYAYKEIIDLYIEKPRSFNNQFSGASSRISFINYLKKKCNIKNLKYKKSEI